MLIHNYRWLRVWPKANRNTTTWEKRLALGPTIAVPGKVSGRCQSRIVTSGVGHNLSQEAPRDFAQAILDVDGYS